jgi:hypothetical protein
MRECQGSRGCMWRRRGRRAMLCKSAESRKRRELFHIVMRLAVIELGDTYATNVRRRHKYWKCYMQSEFEQDDRRADPLFRDLVQDCQTSLDPQGFGLASRGTSESANWVRFYCPAQNALQEAGTLMLLLAHSPSGHTFLADAYFEDAALRIRVPHRKLVQRYDAGDALPKLMHQFVTSVSSWTTSSGYARVPSGPCAGTAPPWAHSPAGAV